MMFTMKTYRHLFAGEAHNASDLGEQPWTRGAPMTVLTVVTCFVAVMSNMLMERWSRLRTNVVLRKSSATSFWWSWWGMRTNIPRR